MGRSPRRSRHRRLRIALLLTLLGGALLLSACDGGGDATADDASPTEGEAATEMTPTDDGDAVDSGEFADLIHRGFGRAVRVTYEVTSPGEAPQTMVWSSDGQQTAWLMPEARVLIRDDGARVFCDERYEHPQCFHVNGEMPTDAMTATAFFGVATAFQNGVDEMAGFSRAGRRDIAGRTATCASFNPAGLLAGSASGEATLCADVDTGVTLSYEAADPEAGAASLMAVELGEPQAGDFEPPIEPVPMDRMHEQMEQVKELQQRQRRGQGS